MLSQEQKQAIIDDYLNNVSYKEMTIRNKCSWSTIYKIVKDANLLNRNIIKMKEKIISPPHLDMIDKYKSGWTLDQIGLEYNISRERVRQILVKHDIKAYQGGRAIKKLIKPKIIPTGEVIRLKLSVEYINFLVEQNHTIPSIARLTGYTKGGIYNFVYRHGIKIRHGSTVKKLARKGLLTIPE